MWLEGKEGRGTVVRQWLLKSPPPPLLGFSVCTRAQPSGPLRVNLYML